MSLNYDGQIGKFIIINECIISIFSSFYAEIKKKIKKYQKKDIRYKRNVYICSEFSLL